MDIEAIGTIESPFTSLEGMPVQPAGVVDTAGILHIHSQFRAGLQDLDGFSHIYVLFHLHAAHPYELVVTPFMDTEKRGVFSTRSPRRPNNIGLSLVALERVDMEKGEVHVRGIDILNGTPLLDIKPYIVNFDYVPEARSGWMTKSLSEVRQRRSDDRFTKD